MVHICLDVISLQKRRNAQIATISICRGAGPRSPQGPPPSPGPPLARVPARPQVNHWAGSTAGPGSHIYLLYLMERFKYAFSMLVVSDGMFDFRKNGDLRTFSMHRIRPRCHTPVCVFACWLLWGVAVVGSSASASASASPLASIREVHY